MQHKWLQARLFLPLLRYLYIEAMTPTYFLDRGSPFRKGRVFMVQAQLLVRHVCLIIEIFKARQVNAHEDPKRFNIFGVAIGWLRARSVGAFTVTSLLPGVYPHMKICIKLAIRIVQSLFI